MGGWGVEKETVYWGDGGSLKYDLFPPPPSLNTLFLRLSFSSFFLSFSL